jgi:hypothetical protein
LFRGVVNTFAEFFNHIGLVYTKCPNRKTDLAKRTEDFRVMINRECDADVRHLPYFYMDCHPEDRLEDGVPEDVVCEYQQNRDQQIDDVLNWTRSKEGYSLEHAEYCKCVYFWLFFITCALNYFAPGIMRT